MGLYVLQARHCLLFVLDSIFKDVHIADSLGQKKVSSSNAESRHTFSPSGAVAKDSIVKYLKSLNSQFSQVTNPTRRTGVIWLSVPCPVGTELRTLA